MKSEVERTKQTKQSHSYTSIREKVHKVNGFEYFYSEVKSDEFVCISSLFRTKAMAVMIKIE
jgi:hypothetical protein